MAAFQDFAALGAEAAELGGRARLAAARLTAAEGVATQAAEDLRQAAACGRSVADSCVAFAETAEAFGRQHGVPVGAAAGPPPPRAKAPPPADPAQWVRPGAAVSKAPPASVRNKIRPSSKVPGRWVQKEASASAAAPAAASAAAPAAAAASGSASSGGAAASAAAPAAAAASGSGAWQRSGGGNSENRRRRGSAHRFKDAAEWEMTYGLAPPYFVSAGHEHGYKVHVGDLPIRWAAPDAYAKIVADVLAPAGIAEPEDANLAMPPSKQGYRQMVLTWRLSADAVRAKVALHDFEWVAERVRVNAKYWTPQEYSPWEDDERFYGMAR